MAETDQWYRNYVAAASDAQLKESVPFVFTDGDRGSMTREEMLLHVAVHAAGHRGEVCRVLWQLDVTPPWDTLAVYLHQAEPERRLPAGGEPVRTSAPVQLR
ncbi:MAG: DinB family protein [Rubrivivax sp.]